VTAPLVSVVVLNYQGAWYLRRLMTSLLAQTYPALEVIVVDNASPDGSIAIVEREFADPRVRVVPLARNVGFSAGNTAGIAVARGDYLLLCNNDVELAPDCVARLLAAAPAHGRLGALAPKIVWFHRPEYVESVGTFCTRGGGAYNHGVGQVDLGQLDRPERVFGACFAAVLIPRAALDEVGPLDPGYFMYYEDVDWCWRANRRGLPVWTVPEAVVRHVHSGTLRHTGAAWKRERLARNHLRFALLNLPGLRGWLFQLLKVVTPLRYWRVWLTPADVRHRLRVFAHLAIRLPVLLAERRRRRRDPANVVADEEIFALADHRESFFVSEKMYPEPSLRALVAMMRERLRGRPSPAAVRALGLAMALRLVVHRDAVPWVVERLRDAWRDAVAGVRNVDELLRFAATIPLLREALGGPPAPDWDPDRTDPPVVPDGAAPLLDAVLAGAPADRLVLALARAEWARTIRGRPGVPDDEIAAALAAVERDAGDARAAVAAS
jgi:GT2 family glycosyltransferase